MVGRFMSNLFWNVTNGNVQQISTFIAKIGELSFITQYNYWQYSCTWAIFLKRFLKMTCVRLQNNNND